LAALNHYLRAVAIVFDFMNPVLALWRLIDRGSKLWLDEPEARNYAKHRAVLRLVDNRQRKKPRRWIARASSLFHKRRDGDGRETITSA
jgi:hypothetical protein